MKNLSRRIVAELSVLAWLATMATAWAVPSEDELLKDLNSGDAGKIVDAFQAFEKHYPTSPNVVPFIKKFLDDPRETVKRKAAREAGILHVDLSPAELKQVCGLLTSGNSKAVVDGLKALRDIKRPEAVPDILPCLKNSNKFVIRDACRTLAVIGSKDLIPSIQPLLAYPDPAVQKDAQEAISKLQAKS
jgi:HEAT repeat protein